MVAVDILRKRWARADEVRSVVVSLLPSQPGVTEAQSDMRTAVVFDMGLEVLDANV